jgi:hypothetical protein
MKNCYSYLEYFLVLLKITLKFKYNFKGVRKKRDSSKVVKDLNYPKLLAVYAF